jgi:hypothetical protein
MDSVTVTDGCRGGFSMRKIEMVTQQFISWEGKDCPTWE